MCLFRVLVVLSCTIVHSAILISASGYEIYYLVGLEHGYFMHSLAHGVLNIPMDRIARNTERARAMPPGVHDQLSPDSRM